MSFSFGTPIEACVATKKSAPTTNLSRPHDVFLTGLVNRTLLMTASLYAIQRRRKVTAESGIAGD